MSALECVDRPRVFRPAARREPFAHPCRQINVCFTKRVCTLGYAECSQYVIEFERSGGCRVVRLSATRDASVLWTGWATLCPVCLQWQSIALIIGSIEYTAICWPVVIVMIHVGTSICELWRTFCMWCTNEKYIYSDRHLKIQLHDEQKENQHLSSNYQQT